MNDLPPSLRPPTGGLPGGAQPRKPAPKTGGGLRLPRVPWRISLPLGLIAVLLTALWLLSFLLPASPATLHEQLIGWTRGGIVLHSEETFVDGCVTVPGAAQPQAVTRTVRTTEYADGTSLQVIFSSAPRPTNACQ
jgi:hypothetical protein